jgi:uncharacterized protein
MKLEYDLEAIQEFCRERGIAKLELFGSALGDKFTEKSDVDLLATLRPGVKCGLFEWVSLGEDLGNLFGRSIDLVSRRAVERSRNEYRKRAILSKTSLIYAEGASFRLRKSSPKPTSSPLPQQCRFHGQASLSNRNSPLR